MTRWYHSHQMTLQDHDSDLPTPFERYYDSMQRATAKVLNATMKVKVSLISNEWKILRFIVLRNSMRILTFDSLSQAISLSQTTASSPRLGRDLHVRTPNLWSIEMEDLRYPIGKFTPDKNLTADRRQAMIEEIAAMPANLKAAVKGLSEKQIDTPYRPSGWTVRQLVHHIADSHLNSFMRFKLAMTEDKPTIRTYDQQLWANTADTLGSIETSVTLLEVLHQRWVMLLHSLTADDFKRKLNHPEIGQIDLSFLVNLYAWHGKHHVAHIIALRQREGWK